MKHSRAGIGLQVILCETGSGRESPKKCQPMAKLGQADCACILYHWVGLGWYFLWNWVGPGSSKILLSIVQLVQAGETKFIKHSKAGTGLQGILCETGSGRESQNNYQPIAKLGQANPVCIP